MLNDTVFFIIAILAGPVLLSLLIWAVIGLSAILYWYEIGNSNPERLNQPIVLHSWAKNLAIAVKEYLTALVSLLLYPLGMRKQKLSRVDNDRPVVLLIHGIYMNRASCFYLQWRLRRAGLNVVSINLPPWKNIEVLTECIDRTVGSLRQSGYRGAINLVGHSLGGMLARNYVQRRGGEQHIHCCITIAAPHFGSRIVPFSVSRLARELAPQSNFIQQINQTRWPEQVQFFSLFTSSDMIILPPGHDQHPLARNIEVHNSGHVGLLYHHQTISHIRTIITEADHV